MQHLHIVVSFWAEVVLAAEILIVDDRPENLLALEAVLAPLGRRITRANSGEEALTILLSRDVAVILLDVRMTAMDGFQTAALIRGRRRSREIPIIFVTAYDAEFREARRAYDLGAFDTSPSRSTSRFCATK
jgi:CheY-like chemotaxis protein